jgi:signal transduction histidine kinase
MVENEISIFIVLATIVLLIFIGGIIYFLIRYRSRKVIYDNEKMVLNQQHTKELLTTQLESQQQTMQDIGREIHDNVGQKLTLASIYLKQISHNNQFPEFENKISEINKILNESLQDLRQLSASLVQPASAQFGIIDLLEKEATKINHTGLCRMTIEAIPEQISINIATKNNLFRLIQEFIQNSLKHAKCKHISIKIKQNSEEIILFLADDGVGFDTQNQSLGIGLSNMKRRADLMGASYYLHSEIGKGTSLELILENKL